MASAMPKPTPRSQLIEKYAIPCAIVIGVVVGTLLLFYMALYGVSP